MADFLPDPVLILTIAFSLLSFTFFVGSLVALRRKRIFGSITGVLLTLLLLTISALLGTVSVGLRGYRALTKEEVVAVVNTTPAGPQRFRAVFHFPDGQSEVFVLAGDELYVDAHILKWKSIANLLGLHTEYELDRVSGRYRALEDERNAQRTVFSLSENPPVDLFSLRRRFPKLAPIVDAEYGSASFIAADQPATYELRLSTTGLLLRPVDAAPTLP